MVRRILLAQLVLFLFIGTNANLQAEPLVEKYFREGKLADGETALLERLKLEPRDDQARFSLAFVQFLQGVEQLGRSLHTYGLRTERGFVAAPPVVRELFPQNPEPKKIAYRDIRQIIETFAGSLGRMQTTLAGIKDPAVALPLHLGQFKLDLFGQNRPVNVASLFGQANIQIPQDMIDKFVIRFDRGDVDWLAGYSHLLSAGCEILLAMDGQELFECTAHLFFESVDSPHLYLQTEPRKFDNFSFSRPLISDIIAFIHLWRFPLKEPARMPAALTHLESMLKHAKAMWKHYQAETDDEDEWIPNPKQTGVLQIPVTDEIVATWLETLDETTLVLQGKRLVPFWRGALADRGVNLRKVFTEPRLIDPILWIQGTAATPYLEQGELTKFSSDEMLTRINTVFGGANFFTFAFWFN